MPESPWLTMPAYVAGRWRLWRVHAPRIIRELLEVESDRAPTVAAAGSCTRAWPVHVAAVSGVAVACLFPLYSRGAEGGSSASGWHFATRHGHAPQAPCEPCHTGRRSLDAIRRV